LRQVFEPLVIGQTSLFGAVISEQAARTKEAITVAAMKRRRRIMGKLLIREEGFC
jgi:hypothetical protein